MNKITNYIILLSLYIILFSSITFISYSNNLPKPTNTKLPHNIFYKIIDSTERFVINHQVEFKHIDVPVKYYNMFNGFIKDSTVMTVSGLKSLVYYHYTTKSGEIFNGDIYWNDKFSYIIFTIDGKAYVNYFGRDGITQLKNLFKL